MTSISILTYGTDARDIVAGEDLVVAEADDEVAVVVSLAALRFAVAAVQLHLDLALAVTLHGWPERNVEAWGKRAGGPEKSNMFRNNLYAVVHISDLTRRHANSAKSKIKPLPPPKEETLHQA